MKNISPLNRFKLTLIEVLSLFGFVLICIRVAWEEVEAFVRWFEQ